MGDGRPCPRPCGALGSHFCVALSSPQAGSGYRSAESRASEGIGAGKQERTRMGRPSNIPPAPRTELVLAVLRGTEKLEVLARRHQVRANTLRKWRDEFVAAGEERLSGRGGRGDRGGSHAAAAQAEKIGRAHV